MRQPNPREEIILDKEFREGLDLDIFLATLKPIDSQVSNKEDWKGTVIIGEAGYIDKQ